MYLRIFKIRVDPQIYDTMAAIEDRVNLLYVRDRGCLWSRFIVDRGSGTWGNVSLWEDLSLLDALKASPDMQVIVRDLKPLLLEPPKEEIYEVYEPRS